MCIVGLSFEKPYLMEALNLIIVKSTKTAKICGFWADLRSESAKTAKSADFWLKSVDFQPKSTDFVWFYSLKLENCWLVLSPERESKWKISIFSWKSAKTAKSMDLGWILGHNLQNPQKPQNLWILAENLWILMVFVWFLSLKLENC